MYLIIKLNKLYLYKYKKLATMSATSNLVSVTPIVLAPPYPPGTHRPMEVTRTNVSQFSLPVPLIIERGEPIPYDQQPSGSQAPTIEQQERVRREGFFQQRVNNE